MDERVLERMVSRSVRTIQNFRALALAAIAVFAASIFWVTLHVLLGGIGGIFRLPMVFLIASFSILPAVLSIIPLASWCLSARFGHEALPFRRLFISDGRIL